MGTEDSTSNQNIPVVSQLEGPSLREIEWSKVHRIAFRFVFLYVLLFLGSFAGFFAPLSLPIVFLSQEIWGALVPMVAEHLMHLPPPTLNSDGDGLGHWIQIAGCGVISVFMTLIWSVVDRNRTNYIKLSAWLQTILRYALGVIMVFYGLAKVYHLQMLPPHLSKLVQPYGDSSPTSLLWIMMGSSGLYSFFTGFVELVGGVLLFHRRTTALGGLITFGAMSQVVVLNMSYDVSVKSWSMSLLALTMVLLAPHIPRLYKVLVLNRPSEPVEFLPLFERPQRNRWAYRVGMTCLAITLGIRLFAFTEARGKAYGRTPVEIFGIYNVESFSSNGDLLPPLLTDERRWRRVIIERSGLASVHIMNDNIIDFLTSVDSEEKKISFLENPDETMTAAGGNRMAFNPREIENRFKNAVEKDENVAVTLEYSREDDGGLSFSGPWGDDLIEVQLSRVDESEFLLLKRGFHWVQDYPFFR